MNDGPQDHLLFMLGEMRADLKYLVADRHKSNERLDGIEQAHTALHKEHDIRLTTLETFKTRIGVITAALGFAAPAIVTVILRKFGLV